MNAQVYLHHTPFFSISHKKIIVRPGPNNAQVYLHQIPFFMGHVHACPFCSELMLHQTVTNQKNTTFTMIGEFRSRSWEAKKMHKFVKCSKLKKVTNKKLFKSKNCSKFKKCSHSKSV
jgi:hypothetical protein